MGDYAIVAVVVVSLLEGGHLVVEAGLLGTTFRLGLIGIEGWSSA
jgi:hypothetical protein